MHSSHTCNFSGTKISNDVELLTEKLKNVSLTIKDDKIKIDEKISRISNTGDAVASLKDELDRKLNNITQTNNKLEKATKRHDNQCFVIMCRMFMGILLTIQHLPWLRQ